MEAVQEVEDEDKSDDVIQETQDSDEMDLDQADDVPRKGARKAPAVAAKGKGAAKKGKAAAIEAEEEGMSMKEKRLQAKLDAVRSCLCRKAPGKGKLT